PGAAGQQPGQVVVGVVGLRVQPQGLLVVPYGPRVVALAAVGVAPVGQGQGVLGVDAEHGLVVRDGLVELLAVVVGDAPGDVGADVAGVELDYLTVVGDGLVVLLARTTRRGAGGGKRRVPLAFRLTGDRIPPAWASQTVQRPNASPPSPIPTQE